MTGTVVVTPLRTTTSRLGTALGQSWVLQIRSEPEVTLTTTDEDETEKVQAGWVPCSWSAMVTRPPAHACAIEGVTLTSSSAHGPLGATSGTAEPEALAAPGVEATAVGPTGSTAALREAAGGFVGAEFAAEFAAVSPDGASDPPAPTSLPIPKTRSSATATTRARRTQYTRFGRRPRGDVIEPMGPR